MIYSDVMSSLHQSLTKRQQPKAGRKENQAQADEQYVSHRNTSATSYHMESICGMTSIRGQENEVRGQERVKNIKPPAWQLPQKILTQRAGLVQEGEIE
jgi:hypothetical protein